MAKLTAHGQEVIRLQKELGADLGTTERRKILSIRSDGWVMEKYQVRFAPDQYRPKGELHDWGWHRKGRIKATFTADQVADRYCAAGYVRA